MVAGVVDALIVYRIIRMLVTPWERQEAFKLGIIDNKGKPLKKYRDLGLIRERENYTILHRMVFRFKRVIEKVPMENKQFLSFAAAVAMLKEDTLETMNDYFEQLEEQDDVETLLEEYVKLLHEDSPVNVVGTYSPPSKGAMEKVDLPLDKQKKKKKKDEEEDEVKEETEEEVAEESIVEDFQPVVEEAPSEEEEEK